MIFVLIVTGFMIGYLFGSGVKTDFKCFDYSYLLKVEKYIVPEPPKIKSFYPSDKVVDARNALFESSKIITQGGN